MKATATLRQMFIAAGLLMGFAVVGTGLVALTFTGTKARIAANEEAALLENLNALVPADRYDNSLIEDTLHIVAPVSLGTRQPVTVYRAYRDQQPVALLATPVAPNGYSGPIKLLVGVYADGALAGVRVLNHRETPGLGDAIEIERSDWIRAFEGKTLSNPPLEKWQVEKDGGVFDQFTGATVTPRAVVSAVRRFLIYVEKNQAYLFNVKSSSTGEHSS
jgi:electron transport complex protein RnfG